MAQQVVEFFPDLPGALQDNSVRIKAPGLKIGEVQVTRHYMDEPTPTVKKLKDGVEDPWNDSGLWAMAGFICIDDGKDAEGKPLERPRPAPPIQLDSQVELILGDRVDVNALGFISRIAGAVTFTNRPGQPDLIPEADGRLLIEDGTFRAFGQDLEIDTGQVIFARVPVTEPELNIQAVRWIDNDPQISAAGVLISGPATEPLLELFSRPQLDPSEIQSYLLTGRSAGDRDSVLSIGTYLHPKLYVGYGYNLLEKTNEFYALYTITPRYGVGASVGEANNSLNLTFTHER